MHVWADWLRIKITITENKKSQSASPISSSTFSTNTIVFTHRFQDNVMGQQLVTDNFLKK